MSDSNGLMIFSKFDQFLREVLKLPTAVFEGPSFGYTENSVRTCFSQQVSSTLERTEELSCSPILGFPSPVGAEIAKWLLQHPMGSVATTGVSLGEGTFIPFPRGNLQAQQWGSLNPPWVGVENPAVKTTGGPHTPSQLGPILLYPHSLLLALLECHLAVPPALRCSTDWCSLGTSGTYALGTENLLYGTFMAPIAGGTHLPPVLLPIGLGP